MKRALFLLIPIAVVLAGCGNAVATPQHAAATGAAQSPITVSNVVYSPGNNSPLEITWQISTADLPALKISACDGSGNCQVFRSITCQSASSCSVADEFGDPRDPSSYTLKLGMTSDHMRTYNLTENLISSLGTGLSPKIEAQ